MLLSALPAAKDAVTECQAVQTFAVVQETSLMVSYEIDEDDSEDSDTSNKRKHPDVAPDFILLFCLS